MLVKTIIVGAGPAGLMAGKYLKDCLILDQKKEIGRPVQCAEAINKTFLDKEGILPNPSWISTEISTVQVVAPSGKAISMKSDKVGYILDRPNFEKFLAQQSKAEIKLNSRIIDVERKNNLWEVKTAKGETFKAKYLIGADGPLSIVRRKIFKEKVEILPAFEYLVELEKEIEPSIMKMYFDREKFPDGYVWIFPKSKKTANIGLGGRGNLAERFQYFMEKIVKPDFGNYKLLKNISGTITWGGAKITLFKENAFLTGDAGALGDPVLGGGMANAMISGRIAAECILTQTPYLYEKKIKSMAPFSPDLLSAQKILYSMPNQVLNQLASVLDKKDIFYLKTLPGFLELLKKNQLRKHLFKILKFFYILEKNGASFA